MKAILLINIGSPMDLKISSIRKYLREFLSDDSVLDFPKILQFILVNFIIVPFRSPKTKMAYEQIWTDQGSPLITNTRSLAQKLSEKINIPVEVAMRYQEPSIKDGLNNLIDKGCKEILAVPLYPQYSQSTSLSTKLKIESVVKNIENDVSVNISEPFFRENGYILALKNSIQDNLPNEYDYLLFSYHGIPERHVRKVDPTVSHCFSTDDCCDIESPSHEFCYRHQAFSTSKLCAEEIGLENEKWSVSFQSRIGPGWLTPFTDKVLEQLPKKNIKKLAVVCPSFAVDNLETLEEMEIRGRETFLNSGGKEFTYIPCLNDDSIFVDFLSDFVSR